jgi:transposase
MANKFESLVFKPTQQHQMSMLPPSLDELIDSHHPVRVVNKVVDQIDLSTLYSTYKGGGTSSYHPRMLLKVLIYGYVTNLYSSRKMETALKENIHFMWLAGMQRPDHNTINRFRGKRLAPYIKEIFVQVVHLLVDEGVLDLKAIFTDGTFMEARSNRYTFVWAKNTARHKTNLINQLEHVWTYAQSVTDTESKDTEPIDFKKISPDKVDEVIQKIDQQLQQAPDDAVCKKQKQKVKQLKKKAAERLDTYNRQQELLDGRKSYSKTDPDATFMRTKQDRLGKGELRPGYNLQVSSADQFIVHWSLHQTSNDSITLPGHLQEFNEYVHQLPKHLVADAGYGSEENYNWLEGHGIQAYVKYSEFDKEQAGGSKWKQRQEFASANLYYNAEKDCYYCPMGQPMTKVGIEPGMSDNGFEKKLHRYRAQNCRGCPMRGRCFKGDGNREIVVNHNLNAYKAQARERLISPQGVAYRCQRSVDTEPVFGQLKYNWKFDRFTMFGKVKAGSEFGLLAIAHNLCKWINNTKNGPNNRWYIPKRTCRNFLPATNELVAKIFQHFDHKFFHLHHLALVCQR